MPITSIEKLGSRAFTAGLQPSMKMIFIVKGSDDVDEIGTYLALNTSSFSNSLNRTTFGTTEQICDGVWLAEVNYGSMGDTEYSFSTTGGTQKILSSLGTVKYAASGVTPPDFGGLINVSGPDQCDGVDITIPVWAFSEAYYFPDSVITDGFKNSLFRLTGTKNKNSFRNLAAGECLFLGAQGSKRGLGQWQIRFDFAASQNVTGLTIGPITGVAKLGWDYLWIYTRPKAIGSPKIMAPVPYAVYVEKVYNDGDFSGLGIGS